MKRALLTLFLVCPALRAEQPSILPAGYRVENIETPEGVTFEVTGLDVASNGDVFAGTRFGQVWRLHEGEWSLFADGLHEITGLDAGDFKGGGPPKNPFTDWEPDAVYAGHKPELTKLVDEDGDGHADLYETVTDEFGFNGNYHMYNFSPVRDSAGNFYGTLNLGHGGDKNAVRVRNSGMSCGALYRGTVYKVTPEGEFSVHAWGLRSPAGIGINQKTDEVFYTDNQGDWNPVSSLRHVTEGAFFGHPASLSNHPVYKEANLDEIPIADFKEMMKLPAVWIPQGQVANSPGNPEWNHTEGKFGPFEGQIFIGDQTRSNVFRAVLEKVGGEYQGAVIEFINHLDCGCIRLAFAPDGSLWVGQTARGWGSVGSVPYGLKRIVYEGKEPPLEIHSVSLEKDGFTVRFTAEIDPEKAAEAGGYAIEHWGYNYSEQYGSRQIDKTKVDPVSVKVAADKRSVRLVLPELKTEKVYRISVPEMGEGLSTRVAYYTLNRLRK